MVGNAEGFIFLMAILFLLVNLLLIDPIYFLCVQIGAATSTGTAGMALACCPAH
jgi:hypothetical protein